MIAANFRRYPEALVIQMPLPFGRALVWALPRPGSRVLHAIRAARAAAFTAHGRIHYPEPQVTPQWARDAKRLSSDLAKTIKSACIRLDFFR